MRLRYVPILAALLSVPCLATDPPLPKSDAPPPVVSPDWPVTIPKKDVIPAPMPSVTETLLGGEWYVVQGNGNEQLLSSPPGVVSITEETGPITLRGTFVNSGGKVETRKYEKKQVFIVERIRKPDGTFVEGQFELLKVPKGVIERHVIGDGTDPIPPPKPKPKPDDPPAPEPAKTFRVIFVHETSKPLTAAQNGVIYGKVVEEYLTKNATGGKAGWKRRDPNTPSEPGVMGDLWTAAKAAMKPTDPPCVVVEKNGNVEIIPVEATPEAMVAVFDKYVKGGK